MLVRQDSLSYGMTVLSVALLIYLSTFSSEVLVKATFIVVMMLSALVSSRLFRIEDYDEDISATEGKSIILYFALSMFVIAAINLIPKTFFFTAFSTSFWTSKSLAILIAVAEEQFFRFFLINLILKQVNIEFAAVFLSALLFGVYHFAVYGSDLGSLMVVVGGGVVLGFVAVKTRRVSTTMIAHIANNLLAVV